MRHEVEGGWMLVGTKGDGTPLRLAFGKSALRASPLGLAIGRHPAVCERVIDEASVSRRHARLGLDGRHLVVEDLHSLNGTSIDGRPLDPFVPERLHPGETLSLGAIDLEVRALDEGDGAADGPGEDEM